MRKKGKIEKETKYTERNQEKINERRKEKEDGEKVEIKRTQTSKEKRENMLAKQKE
jgi:hypothetical protein